MDLISTLNQVNAKATLIIMLAFATMTVSCQSSKSQSERPPDQPANQVLEPVEIVKILWAEAIDGKEDARRRFVTDTPASFYDSECPEVQTEKTAVSDQYNAQPPTAARKDSLSGSMIKTLDKVGRKKLRLDKVKLERAKGDEALVEVIYYDAGDNITVQTYALLHREENTWKVFLIAANPELINPKYAADRCN